MFTEHQLGAMTMSDTEQAEMNQKRIMPLS